MEHHPPDLVQVWKTAVEALSQEVPSAAQLAWLNETDPIGLADGVFVLSAPHDFAREQLKRRFQGHLDAALTDVLGEPVTVVITVRPQVAGDASNVGDPAELADAAVEPPGLHEMLDEPARAATITPLPVANLSDKYVFDRFVIGPSNRFAHAAAFAVAEAP